MNEKVDEEYKDIKDVYVLQCICSELKDRLEKYRHLFKTTKTEEKDKEIERQKEVINGMIDNEEKYLLEINKLKSIIKEVREYIENNTLYEQDYDYDYEENLVVGPPSDETARKILLEILDKTNQEYNS